MRILVTGGAGFIGSNLVEQLLQDDRVTAVRVLDNLATGSLKNIEEFSDNRKFEFIEGDIRNYKTCLTACEGMDIISLVRVVHDHDDDVILQVLRNIRSVCSASTTLLIAEPFAGDFVNAAVTDAYFNLYFTAMGQGRTRTPQAIAELAAKAGFGHSKIWRTHMPLITGLMTFLPN